MDVTDIQKLLDVHHGMHHPMQFLNVVRKRIPILPVRVVAHAPCMQLREDVLQTGTQETMPIVCLCLPRGHLLFGGLRKRGDGPKQATKPAIQQMGALSSGHNTRAHRGGGGTRPLECYEKAQGEDMGAIPKRLRTAQSVSPYGAQIVSSTTHVLEATTFNTSFDPNKYIYASNAGQFDGQPLLLLFWSP